MRSKLAKPSFASWSANTDASPTSTIESLSGFRNCLRDALDVGRRGADDAIPVRLDLGEIESVEEMREHLLRDGAPATRSSAGSCRPETPARRVSSPGLTLSFCSRQNSSTISFSDCAGRRRPGVGLGDDVAAALVGVELGRRAVGEPTLGPQHAEQPVRAFAAEDANGQVERQEVRVRPRDADVPDADLGLRRTGTIDDDDALGRRRRARWS